MANTQVTSLLCTLRLHMQEEEQWQEVLARQGNWHSVQISSRRQHLSADSPATGANDANDLASNALVSVQDHVAQTDATAAEASGLQGHTTTALVPADTHQASVAELLRC